MVSLDDFEIENKCVYKDERLPLHTSTFKVIRFNRSSSIAVNYYKYTHTSFAYYQEGYA